MKSNTIISISTGTFLKAVLIIVALWFLWYIHQIVLIFFVSLLLAALIDPFAEWFAKRHIPRGLSVLIVYTFLITVIALIVVGIIPIITDQYNQFTSNISVFSKGISNTFNSIEAFSSQHGLIQDIPSSLETLGDSATKSIGSFFTTVKDFFGGAATVIIILVLTFYMVAEGEKMQKYFKSLAPVEYQPYLSEMAKKMQTKIGAWMRAQLLLGFIVGLTSFIGLQLLGVRYALILAILAGLFELIPYVGPIFSAIPAAIVALAQAPILALAVIALYIIIQQLENNILVPKIMQKVTGLNPVISIMALLIGVKIGGIFGAIFAIPVAILIVVFLEDVFKEYT